MPVSTAGKETTMTDGMKTSEFWITILIILCATGSLFFDKIDSQIWVTCLGFSGGGYAISRGLAKKA